MSCSKKEWSPEELAVKDEVLSLVNKYYEIHTDDEPEVSGLHKPEVPGLHKPEVTGLPGWPGPPPMVPSFPCNSLLTRSAAQLQWNDWNVQKPKISKSSNHKILLLL
jgi:hypothetical protein